MKHLNIYSLLIFIILIFGGHILSLVIGGYYKIWWADNALHFLGGLWVGLLVLWFLFNSGKSPFSAENLPVYVLIIMALSFAALVGVLWEFFEFIQDKITGYKSYSPIIMQENLKDTLSDLLFDLLGALASGLFLKFRKRNVKPNKET